MKSRKIAIAGVMMVLLLAGVLIGNSAFPIYADEITGDTPVTDETTVTEAVYGVDVPVPTEPSPVIPLPPVEVPPVVTVPEPVLIEYSDRVYDTRSDEGIADVKVTTESKETEKQYSTKTDDNGRFTLQLPAGEYVLTLEKEGFKTVTTDITVEDTTGEQGQ